MKRKRVYLPVILLFLCLSFFTFKYVQSVQEDRSDWRSFLNRFYYSVDDAIFELDYLLSKDISEDRLGDRIRELERDLLKSQYIYENAKSYIDSSLYGSFLFEEAAGILYGLQSSGTVDVDLARFDQDGRLDADEKKLLTTIREDLDEIREEMHANEPGKPNPDLTVEQLNEGTKFILSKNRLDIYRDTF
ncbi:hypothetical protein LCM20_12030 [Halobacillus litoralis]|uniref:hypothetical protein n=1 Tax=Halobacillus litoralis TaxID=45668 RepID=UPI001CD5AD49|nr:hypothetical protein [Halobacillus litoralis]MCA0971326.1 hypothetical protein [Halobacillus litoralis]